MTATEGVQPTPYDAVAYPGYAFAETHPDRLAVNARLFGLRPADPARCRFLELGCGDGGNLVPMALGLPEASFVGIDLSSAAIARGRDTAEQVGAANLELLQGDLAALPEDLGEFDYIAAHGVYSWIPPAARDGLMAACGRLLTPHGVAYVSYNAYPGSHLRDMAREILLFHTKGEEDPEARVARARSLMRLLVTVDEQSPFARVLREHAERLLEYNDWLLYHDELAEVNSPVYFHQFVAHAAEHGLQFLSEANIGAGHLSHLPAEAVVELEALGDDVVVREQYIDFIVNRMFRETLLCRADVAVDRTLDPDDVRELLIAMPAQPTARPDLSPGAELEFRAPGGRASIVSADPLVKGALLALARAWPTPMAFEELRAAAARELGGADVDAGALAMAVFQAHLGSVAELRVHAPALAAAPGERPVASRLARLQSSRGGNPVTTLRHSMVHLSDPLARVLLLLLDGTRDRDDLAEALRAAPPEPGVELPPDDELPEALDTALHRLARLGLLEA